MSIRRLTMKGQPIDQYDFKGNYIKTFKNATEAAKAIGVCLYMVCLASSGKRKSAGGYIWRYKKKSLEHKYHNDIPELPKTLTRKSKSKKVAQYDLEGRHLRTYKTAVEAARLTGIDANNITRSAKGTRITGEGFLWRYCENDWTFPKVAFCQCCGKKVEPDLIVKISVDCLRKLKNWEARKTHEEMNSTREINLNAQMLDI